MRLRRASKSGNSIFFGSGRGGGDSSAMTLPFLTISTSSPPATHSRTLPGLRRNCLTFAVFMFNKCVWHACQNFPRQPRQLLVFALLTGMRPLQRAV
jgi:hypothetical protein